MTSLTQSVHGTRFAQEDVKHAKEALAIFYMKIAYKTHAPWGGDNLKGVLMVPFADTATRVMNIYFGLPPEVAKPSDEPSEICATSGQFMYITATNIRPTLKARIKTKTHKRIQMKQKNTENSGWVPCILASPPAFP